MRKQHLFFYNVSSAKENVSSAKDDVTSSTLFVTYALMLYIVINYLCAEFYQKRNMKLKINYFIFAYVLSQLCSCSGNEQTNIECKTSLQVDLQNVQKEKLASSFVSDIEVVQLELPEPYFFGVVHRVLFGGSSIFVIDEKQSTVFRFDKNGTFICKIGTKGEGPGEYIHITDCFIDDKNVYLCDQDVRSIHIYSYDGTYIRTITSPFNLVYDDIEALPNGDFFCHYVTSNKNNAKFWIMGKNGECKQVLLKHDNIYPYSNTQWSTITKTAIDTLWIHDPIHEIVYSYDSKNDNLTAEIALNSNLTRLDSFGGIKILPPEEQNYSPCLFILNSSHSIFSLWASADWRLTYSLYDKSSMQNVAFEKIVMDIQDYPHFPLVVSSNKPNALVSLMTDETPVENFPEQYRSKISERTALLYIINLK
ncbi:MAG: 6-bladed beta-propeller [Mediterranea sp.]|jgi:hypothetical protein|nr:6-bladed beta-propeller [Mediterranea sp.]